jgi:hypothetical protein
VPLHRWPQCVRSYEESKTPGIAQLAQVRCEGGDGLELEQCRAADVQNGKVSGRGDGAVLLVLCGAIGYARAAASKSEPQVLARNCGRACSKVLNVGGVDVGCSVVPTTVAQPRRHCQQGTVAGWRRACAAASSLGRMVW